MAKRLQFVPTKYTKHYIEDKELFVLIHRGVRKFFYIDTFIAKKLMTQTYYVNPSVKITYFSLKNMRVGYEHFDDVDVEILSHFNSLERIPYKIEFGEVTRLWFNETQYVELEECPPLTKFVCGEYYTNIIRIVDTSGYKNDSHFLKCLKVHF